MTSVLGTCYIIFINVCYMCRAYTCVYVYVYVYMRVLIRIYMYIHADLYAYTYIYICLARLVIAEMNNQIGREKRTVNQTIFDSIIIIVIIIQYHNIMIIVLKIR